MPQEPTVAQMPQMVPTSPGQIGAQANAAVNTADKMLPQILSALIEAVDQCTANVNAKPSA